MAIAMLNRVLNHAPSGAVCLKHSFGCRAHASRVSATPPPLLQMPFRRTPLRVQAARIGGVEVPNQK